MPRFAAKEACPLLWVASWPAGYDPSCCRLSSAPGSRDDAHLRDASGLAPGPRDTRAHLASLATPGEDDAIFWGPDPASEGAHSPHVAEPTTPLQQRMEEVDEGNETPRGAVFDLSPVRPPVHNRRGAPRLAAATALDVADLMEERQYEREKERRLFARLPKLDESPKTYAEAETFLATLESDADRAGATTRFCDPALSQISVAVRANFLGRMETKFPDAPSTYKRLTDPMVESDAPGKPERYLLREVKMTNPGSFGILPCANS